MTEYKKIQPRLSPEVLPPFNKLVRQASKVEPTAGARLFRNALKKSDKIPDASLESQLRFSVTCSLLSDVLEQGWKIASFDQSTTTLLLDAPSLQRGIGETAEEVKDRIRAGLTAISNKQLASDAVQNFVQRMEKPKTFKGKKVSIQTLVDDGRALEKEFKTILKSKKNLEENLQELIKPVIQICEDHSSCKFTGLNTLDIWRYFRHTWSLEYKPIPGRTMRVLIRNKARENWPVIGIAMLASPAMNLYVRDEWIGWRLEDLINGLVERKLEPSTVGQVLFSTLEEALKAIRTDDLITKKELSHPKEMTLLKLKQIATVSKNNRHGELTDVEDKKNGTTHDEEDEFLDIRSVKGKKINWKKLSSTSLYRKKRAETLVPILRSFWHFKGANIQKEPSTGLYALLSNKLGRDAVSVALNELRKRKLASQVADVSVCGAIAPYNDILGGKLITMLMGSEEIRRIYKARYDGQISEIASQIAGKPVSKSADLMLLTTTSLYGIGSSQYNKIKFKKGFIKELAQDYAWQELQLTSGYGITHLGDESVLLMRKLSRLVHGARRVNSVFGEGSSPRVRLIRDALLILGLNDDTIMKHGLSRIVYACELYPGARGDLSGFYTVKGKRKAASADALTKTWIQRWVAERVKRPEISQRLKDTPSSVISEKMRMRVTEYQSLHQIKKPIARAKIKKAA